MRGGGSWFFFNLKLIIPAPSPTEYWEGRLFWNFSYQEGRERGGGGLPPWKNFKTKIFQGINSPLKIVQGGRGGELFDKCQEKIYFEK